VRPLAEFPVEARGRIRGVFTDIDDTLTTHGRLFAAAYAALERLQRAGFLVVPVTGRPAGWCDHIARMWPVDAVVGENGAFWFRHDAKAGRLVKRYLAGDEERLKRGRKLLDIAARILSEVPGSALASDQRYREADIAIDFREDVPELPREEVSRIVEIMEREVKYLVENEWAQTAEDILWRRTKAGLHMTPAQREAFAQFMGR